MEEKNHIYPIFDRMMTRQDKEELLGQHSVMIWFTGLSGSGKSTIAIALERELHKRGLLCRILDGDNIRSGINNNLGFSETDRVENIRRIAEVSKLFLDSGIITIAAFISPNNDIREMAANIIGKDDFLEIFVSTPLEECEKRDVKGLYAKARKGEIKNFTGISAPSKLVDVARQLFAKKGVEDTTMNDIAVASRKGRRTLYTYFKSKEQIYMAVVESELEMLSDRLKEAAGKTMSPDKKILELIMTHLDTIKMVVYRNGTLRASFFRDIWRVEAVRKHFDLNEIVLFRRILEEGKMQGYFDIDNVDITADILHYCIKGIEVPYIRGQIGEDLDDETGWRYVAKIVYGALGCTKKNL